MKYFREVDRTQRDSDGPPGIILGDQCDGTGIIEYYHDAGDHFGGGTAPDSEWIEKQCYCMDDQEDDEPDDKEIEKEYECAKCGHHIMFRHDHGFHPNIDTGTYCSECDTCIWIEV